MAYKHTEQAEDYSVKEQEAATVAAATAQTLCEHAAWQESRQQRLMAPTGPLALVETRWFAPGTTAEEAAKLLAAEAQAAADNVVVTPMHRQRLSGDGEEFGLRRWQADAPAIRAFLGMAQFDYNPEWVVEAVFTPATDGRTVAFEHIQEVGATRELTVPGDVTFTVNGETVTVTGFRASDTELIIPFSDLTTGAGTAQASYAPGRFLAVDITNPEHTGQLNVTLNFNYAYVPPCGFSAHFNCPMPPAQNRLPWEVTAGERAPQYTEGFDVHHI